MIEWIIKKHKTTLIEKRYGVVLMTGNLRDYFCTSTDIAKAWGVEEREIKNQANRISRKFKDILE